MLSQELDVLLLQLSPADDGLTVFRCAGQPTFHSLEELRDDLLFRALFTASGQFLPTPGDLLVGCRWTQKLLLVRASGEPLISSSGQLLPLSDCVDAPLGWCDLLRMLPAEQQLAWPDRRRILWKKLIKHTVEQANQTDPGDTQLPAHQQELLRELIDRRLGWADGLLARHHDGVGRVPTISQNLPKPAVLPEVVPVRKEDVLACDTPEVAELKRGLRLPKPIPTPPTVQLRTSADGRPDLSGFVGELLRFELPKPVGYHLSGMLPGQHLAYTEQDEQTLIRLSGSMAKMYNRMDLAETTRLMLEHTNYSRAIQQLTSGTMPLDKTGETSVKWREGYKKGQLRRAYAKLRKADN